MQMKDAAERKQNGEQLASQYHKMTKWQALSNCLTLLPQNT